MKLMTEDERYIFDERLAILGVLPGMVATSEQFALAWADVERFRREVVVVVLDTKSGH